MTKRTVVVWGTIHKSGLALLQDTPNILVVALDQIEPVAIEPHLATTDAILVRTSLLPESLIERAPNLKVVSRYGVGYDNIDVAALTRRKIPLAVIGDANAISVAEQTLYLMLAAAKRGPMYDRATRNGDWQYRNSLAATDLSGKRLLVVGMGRIGQRVAKLCQAFGMEITYYDPLLRNSGLGPDWQSVPDLESGLSAADVVTVHAPLNADTRAMIGEKELATMKSSVIVVSTSRGGVIDEAALSRALERGAIRAAALDVFETEPVAHDNPLLKLESVVLSPHMAALSLEGAERMAIAAAKNCLDGIEGRLEPSSVVNVEVLDVPAS